MNLQFRKIFAFLLIKSLTGWGNLEQTRVTCAVRRRDPKSNTRGVNIYLYGHGRNLLGCLKSKSLAVFFALLV